jgi:hypothetical protein
LKELILLFYCQMTYNEANLVSHIPHLIELINKRMVPDMVVNHHINTVRNGLQLSRIYIKMSNMTHGYYQFSVSTKGEIWNSLLTPALLSCAFEWLKSIDSKRQIERVLKFKMELYEKCWHPSRLDFLTID